MGLEAWLVSWQLLQSWKKFWGNDLIYYRNIGKYNASKHINFICKFIYPGFWAKLHLGPSCPFPLSKDKLPPAHLEVERWRALTPLDTKLLSCGFSTNQCWALLRTTATRMKRQSGHKLLQSALRVVVSPTMSSVVQMLPIYQAIKLGSLTRFWVPLGVSN